MRRVLLTIAAGVLFAAPAFAGSDVEFMQKAASGGMLEVTLGKHAAANAASPEVKSFGQQMVHDHGQANAELAALAQKEGVALPAEMSAEHQAMAKQLMAKTGATFDVAYMEMMVEDHTEDIEAFEAQAKEGKTEVDRWAAKTLPTLEKHLEMAKDVHQQIASSAPAGEQADPDHGDDTHGRMGPGAATPGVER
jgi:putative membrane protein